MTREEMQAMFTEYTAEGTEPDRQTEILTAVMDENDRINTELEGARTEAQAAKDAYDKLRAQYVNRFLSGGPNNPGDQTAGDPDTDDGGKRRKYEDLFKKEGD